MRATFSFMIFLRLLSVAALLGVLCYLLWRYGCFTAQAKRAIFYRETRGDHARGASFCSCTGYVKSILRFPEDAVYQFTLQTDLSQGNALVEICQGAKDVLCTLDNGGSVSLAVEQGTRYSLVFRYRQATGNCRLVWQ